ncbi:SEC-C metal-binding domain-containing protein [Peribacillus sp. NPDC006672]|uniref:YkgJ family cysteine cluster protein n=1 Tax=Peribacillus sp. NPDC006672 TaxID=3390606 RepID=UPI003CFE1AB8
MTTLSNNKISRNDPCFCGSGKKYKKCHSDVHLESKAANVINLYKEINDKVKTYQEETGNISSCYNGCSNCCYDSFPISEIEFELIMREMKNWKNDKVQELYDRALEQCKQQETDHPDIWENLQSYAHANSGIILKQQLNHGRIYRNSFPCPLLDPETNSCMVYNSRPLICRTFGSTHMKAQSNELYQVCEYIPNSKELETTTPAVDDERIKGVEITNLKAPNGQIGHLRPYPIYYWFHIFYARTEKKVAQYNHYDSTTNFDMPMDQADYYMLKGFNSI